MSEMLGGMRLRGIIWAFWDLVDLEIRLGLLGILDTYFIYKCID